MKRINSTTYFHIATNIINLKYVHSVMFHKSLLYFPSINYKFLTIYVHSQTFPRKLNIQLISMDCPEGLKHTRTQMALRLHVN